jgi:hypothetical protein
VVTSTCSYLLVDSCSQSYQRVYTPSLSVTPRLGGTSGGVSWGPGDVLPTLLKLGSFWAESAGGAGNVRLINIARPISGAMRRPPRPGARGIEKAARLVDTSKIAWQLPVFESSTDNVRKSEAEETQCRERELSTQAKEAQCRERELGSTQRACRRREEHVDTSDVTQIPSEVDNANRRSSILEVEQSNRFAEPSRGNAGQLQVECGRRLSRVQV